MVRSHIAEWVVCLAVIGCVPLLEAAEPPCVKCGTLLDWHQNMQAAQQQAREQGKLLFVLHLSGDFAKPTFT